MTELIRQPKSYGEAVLIMNTFALLHDAMTGIEFDLSSVSFPEGWMMRVPFAGARLEPSILAERLRYLQGE